ncbi:MAG: hypothetical protein Q9169_007408 [Polycauliona sp. 2 TL-2023]
MLPVQTTWPAVYLYVDEEEQYIELGLLADFGDVGGKAGNVANAEARLATHPPTESSLYQLSWPSLDIDFLNSLQAPEGADGLLGEDFQSDVNDHVHGLPFSDTSCDDAASKKPRATLPKLKVTTEPPLPISMSSQGSNIDQYLPEDELTQVYFDTMHPCFPMVNQLRFRSLSPFLSTDRGIASLSDAIWLHAASLIPEKYAQWEGPCYQNARNHLEKLETEDDHGTFMSIDALQAIILIALYEFKQMYFARAWLTIGRAMETVADEAKQITTFLPSMDALDEGQAPLPTRLSLKDAMKEPLVPGSAPYSPFAGAVIMAGFCGRCLNHLQTAHKASTETEYTYDFWSNHYSIDFALNQILSSSLKHLNVDAATNSLGGMTDPNTIFLNMNMRATVICLHQAAVFQAAKSSLPAAFIAESEGRILTAAQEIASVIRLVRTSVSFDKARADPFHVNYHG